MAKERDFDLQDRPLQYAVRIIPAFMYSAER